MQSSVCNAEVKPRVRRGAVRPLLSEQMLPLNTKRSHNAYHPFHLLKRHVLNTRLLARRRPLRLFLFFSKRRHPHQLPSHHVTHILHSLCLHLIPHLNSPTLTLALLSPTLERCPWSHNVLPKWSARNWQARDRVLSVHQALAPLSGVRKLPTHGTKDVHLQRLRSSRRKMRKGAGAMSWRRLQQTLLS
jgi:hypothetical protein